MLLAHLPAGYLLTKAIQRKTGNHSTEVLWAGLIASVLPDIDMLYFYFVDHQQTLHHDYITHIPLFWLFVWIVIRCGLRWFAGKSLAAIDVMAANIMLHMVLDSIAGGINWLYPILDVPVNLVTVPARYDWWVWSFVLHWTFLLELLIISAASLVWVRSCRKPY